MLVAGTQQNLSSLYYLDVYGFNKKAQLISKSTSEIGRVNEPLDEYLINICGFELTDFKIEFLCRSHRLILRQPFLQILQLDGRVGVGRLGQPRGTLHGQCAGGRRSNWCRRSLRRRLTSTSKNFFSLVVDLEAI